MPRFAVLHLGIYVCAKDREKHWDDRLVHVF